MTAPLFPSLAALTDAYARYEKDPVGEGSALSLKAFFDALSPEARQDLHQRACLGAEAAAEPAPGELLDSIRAVMLIRATRTRGHLAARLDPLGLTPPPYHPELDPAAYGFTDADMDRPIFLGGMLGRQTASMREIVALLKQTYEGPLGIEFIHLQNPAAKAWIQDYLESTPLQSAQSHDESAHVLQSLVKAECFESFLQRHFPSSGLFSLEGGEALLPLLEALLGQAGHGGLEQVVIGMAHRGRLNLLCHLIGKPYAVLFAALRNNIAAPDIAHFSGDLACHLGASADRLFDGKRLHLSLSANPSHLGIVAPIVMGRVRAKQDDPLSLIQAGAAARHKILGLVIHGDAAFAGQGIVAETLNLTNLSGYKTGGMIHVVINNQIGYTTAPDHFHSGIHCTDLAKTVQAPILHVNADDPESVVFAARLAASFRQKFHTDIVIDLVCYRRHGHDEKDEPFSSHPLLYDAIAKHPTVSDIYAQRQIEKGLLRGDEKDSLKAAAEAELSAALDKAQNITSEKADWLEGNWHGIEVGSDDNKTANTGVPLLSLNLIADKLYRLPGGFRPHHSVAEIIRTRGLAVETGLPVDWPTAEALAFGSLLTEGFAVRLSGQDSMRGVAFPRHARLVDQDTGAAFIPLDNISPDQARFTGLDSPLSEAAVLAFEYGFSTVDPETLVCWEAQSGDFANTAQVVIDQIIASAETKWLRMSGLTLLLPHGFEGQGAEHSSARMERFLQISADDNWVVAVPSTPANYFHILRKQVKARVRKPLILFTPKKMATDPAATSPLFEMGTGTRFQAVLGDPSGDLVADQAIRRVIVCTGRVFYDLAARRAACGVKDVALVRLEQLYPFPTDALRQELALYPNAEIVWCQEEPENMGAWFFVENKINALLRDMGRERPFVRGLYRPEAATPAAGSKARHLQEQDFLLRAALQKAD